MALSSKFHFLHPRYGECRLVSNRTPIQCKPSQAPLLLSFHGVGEVEPKVMTQTAGECGNPIFHVNLLTNLNYYYA
jgi:hypothetical protein